MIHPDDKRLGLLRRVVGEVQLRSRVRQQLYLSGQFLEITGEAAEAGLGSGCVGLRTVPVAVNVSAIQFLRGDLARDIREIVEEYGIEPEMLEVELTESVLMENTEQSLQQLRLLKEAGIRITVDDFGTGYSSLGYLHWLPLDSLKIDGSFVQKIAGGKPNPIVRAIVDLGRNLGLSVVAEGVETAEQYHELLQINCDLLQGFLFSAPKPAAEIACLLLPEDGTTAAIQETELRLPPCPAVGVGCSPANRSGSKTGHFEQDYE